MKIAIVLLVHLLTGLAILLGTGGTRVVLAENILLKQQLLVLQRSRRRAPNLRTADRQLSGCHRAYPAKRIRDQWTHNLSRQQWPHDQHRRTKQVERNGTGCQWLHDWYKHDDGRKAARHREKPKPFWQSSAPLTSPL